jgi:AbrB family looped-hinge helix DNA binding protein
MDRTRLSSKGQVIIPKSVRDAHGWRAGTEFTVETTPAGLLLKPRKKGNFKRTTIDEVIGFGNYTGPTRTIEQMDEAIAAEAGRRFKRAVGK